MASVKEPGKELRNRCESASSGPSRRERYGPGPALELPIQRSVPSPASSVHQPTNGEFRRSLAQVPWRPMERLTSGLLYPRPSQLLFQISRTTSTRMVRSSGCGMLHERERRNPIQWWNQRRARLSRCMGATATLSNDRVAAMTFPASVIFLYAKSLAHQGGTLGTRTGKTDRQPEVYRCWWQQGLDKTSSFNDKRGAGQERGYYYLSRYSRSSRTKTRE